MSKQENNLLEHAVINQLKMYLHDQEYDSISELINQLIFLEPAKKVLIEFLSDKEKERWLEGNTNLCY